MAIELVDKKQIKVIKDGVNYKCIDVDVITGGVTYHVWNSGSVVTYCVDTNVTYSEEVTNGDSVLSPKSFTPSKSGYTFVGWRTDKTASSSVLTSMVMDTDPITLYAVFKRTLTLSYNGNGSTSGSVSSQNGTQYYNNGNTADPSFTLVSNGFSKTNYRFVAWASGSVEGTQYDTGASVALSASTIFYAVWTEASHYAVQDGVIIDSNLVSSVNVSELSISAANYEENEQTYIVFTLQNADAYSKVKIRFKYRLYVDYGQVAIYINDTLYSDTADNVEHTVEMYVNTKTCKVKLYARNDSSNESWGADSTFQLLDIYVER